MKIHEEIIFVFCNAQQIAESSSPPFVCMGGTERNVNTIILVYTVIWHVELQTLHDINCFEYLRFYRLSIFISAQKS